MEVESVDEGVALYRTSREGRPSSSGTPEQRVIRAAMDRLVPAIEDLQYAVMTRKPMKGIQKWGHTLVSLPADKLALLTLRAVFDCRGSSNSVVMTAIAKGVDLEMTFERIKREDPEQFRSTRKFIKRWTEDQVKLMFRRSSVSKDTKNQKVRWHIGAVLLHAALEHSGVCIKSERYRGRRKRILIDIEPDVLIEIERQHEALQYLRPLHMPMVVPPKPWTDLEEGGYLYTPLTLVKGSYKQSNRIREFSQTGENARALNRVQSVPWRVNKRMLEVVKTLHQQGSTLGGMTPRDNLPLPPKPHDILTNPEAKQDWRRRARQVYEDNDDLKSQRKMLERQVHFGEKFKDYPAIYYVWQLDWRGRMYPCVNSLSPQGDDIGRSMLEFAEGKPLGDRGYFWLTVHLANQMGYDKEMLHDRVRLVEERKAEIIQWAEDPLQHKGWADTDSPYKCLAAAFEWAEATRMERREEFLSRVPVAMDGSCNGLQHLSAIGLDPVGAAATNLVPTDRPNDIYRDVAARLDSIVREDQSDNEDAVRDHAAHWLPRISRTLCKRPTMTTPYSVTKQGIRMQLLDDGFLRDLEGEINAHANYIRDRMHEAIGGVVVAAREIMDWLQECARQRNADNRTLQWHTPTGFFIDQSYIKLKRHQIDTVLQKLHYWIPYEDRRLYPQRQISGIAPNFVHSLDAAHLTMVVNALFDNGLDYFSAVHDSFATHAADTDWMHEVIRDEFIRLHSQPLLEMFRQENGEDLPEPPSKGTFDLEGVRDAVYAFS